MMTQIESLEYQLAGLAKSAATAARHGWTDVWADGYERFKSEVKQAKVHDSELGLQVFFRILPKIEVLDEVLRGMQEDRRRGEE
jgi:hypothetical protein